MTAAADRLLQDVLRLPVEDRSRIATRIIESVEDDEDFELSHAWQAEINRRVESIKDGSAQLVDHDQVMDSVRQKLALQRTAKSHS
jgi:putative addiction module component (TIGR02574 family)